MRDNQKIALNEMRNRLQARLHYAHPESAFDALLYGYERHSKRIGWARNVRYKGWLSPQIAREFAQYCGYPIDKP